MNGALLQRLGNIDQLAGIRESRLTRGKPLALAEFYNAAGLRFTVVPDRCCDIYDLSFRGVNFSFQSKNGLQRDFSPVNGEFTQHWPGGMLVTCGLDNVGGHWEAAERWPTHGRIAALPARTFGTQTVWEGDRYILRCEGETHQTSLYGSHLSLRRRIETELEGKTVEITDTITNFEDGEAPYLLLYHMNFGYPLLSSASRVAMPRCRRRCLNGIDGDPFTAEAPVAGAGESLYLYTGFGPQMTAVLYNRELELGAYVTFTTEHLPDMLQWKLMKTHDYVMAFEPCNSGGANREKAKDTMPRIPAYSSLENRLVLGVLEGMGEINAFIQNL